MRKRHFGLIVLIIAIVYLILPVDVIPDILVGLGQIDDAIMLGISILTMVHQHKLNKRKRYVEAQEV